jgi:hypothetical protein
MHERFVRRISPQIATFRTNIASRLVLRVDAVHVGIGKRIGWQLAHHDAYFAACISRHPHVARNAGPGHANKVAALDALGHGNISAP